MFKPAVTAVIPCHNHEKWVMQAVDSVVAQTYKVNKIIVVDDGSTDNSLQTVINSANCTEIYNVDGKAWYKGQRNNVKLELYKNDKAYGPSYARNIGIKAGWNDTDIYALLDSDDLYKPDKIQK